MPTGAAKNSRYVVTLDDKKQPNTNNRQVGSWTSPVAVDTLDDEGILSILAVTDEACQLTVARPAPGIIAHP